MKTITEIKSMNLLDLQKLVLDLRANVPQSDKYYAVALQLINTATGMRDWKEPQTIEVRNVAGHDVTIDKTTIAKDGTGKVYPWQYLAAPRFLEAINREDHDAAVATHVRKPGKGEDDKPLSRADIINIVKANSITEEGLGRAIAGALKAAGIVKAAAALIAFMFLLFGSSSAMAQTTTYAVGSSPSSYHSYYVANLNGTIGGPALGGTNSLTGTNYFNLPVFSTNTIIAPNNIWSNGIIITVLTTNNAVTTNWPNVVSLVNYDLWDAQFSYGLLGAGTGTNAYCGWSYSSDDITWQTNALILTLGCNGTATVVTNAIISQFAEGWARLDWIGCVVTITNPIVQVPLKPIKGAGPG
jgi:hypothetical protein